MIRLEIEEFRESVGADGHVFDVRTPAEFEQGHIPGAINLPLFSNDERAAIGTTYKQVGRHQAILDGLDMIGPRMRGLVEAVQERVGAPDAAPPIHVHCWRGGMRSGSVAWLLEMYGFEVRTLVGGYKAFRRWVLATVAEPPPLRVLGGRTGSGKTLVLDELAALGEPVLDLEGLANHRGSAFGALGLGEQPTQEQFEALVAVRLAELGDSAVWVEDESRMIGRRQVPDPLMAAMRSSVVFALHVGMARRVRNLVEVYGDAAFDELRTCFDMIEKRLGRERKVEAHAALDERDLARAAEIALSYYDKTYDYGLSRRNPERVEGIHGLDDMTPREIAQTLRERAADLDRRDDE